MIPRSFDDITKADLDALVTNAVAEKRTIEYKLKPPDGTDDAKKEFLADVSSFANASGGDLIFGVEEKLDANGKPTGIPELILGLAGVNADAEKLRMGQMLLAGIEPRIPGLRITHLDGFPDGPAILVRVPKSWASPHMVTYKNLSRFFSRTSAGKYQLDVREIRSAILLSETLERKITDFRSDRISKVLCAETPIKLLPGPAFVVHIVPITSFADLAPIDLNSVESLRKEFMPLGQPHSWAPQFNFNGVLFFSLGSPEAETNSYVQIFRNGCVEAVCTKLVQEPGFLLGNLLEREMINGVKQYVTAQQKLGINLPSFVGVSVVGSKGLRVIVADPYSPGGKGSKDEIAEEVLVTQEVLIEERGKIQESLMTPLDTIWQASGWPRSQCLDKKGNFIKAGPS